MKRRELLSGVGGAAFVGLAGCLGSGGGSSLATRLADTGYLWVHPNVTVIRDAGQLGEDAFNDLLSEYRKYQPTFGSGIWVPESVDVYTHYVYTFRLSGDRGASEQGMDGWGLRSSLTYRQSDSLPVRQFTSGFHWLVDAGDRLTIRFPDAVSPSTERVRLTEVDEGRFQIDSDVSGPGDWLRFTPEELGGS